MTNHSCIACGREIVDGTKFQICKDCFCNLHKLEGNLCDKCGDEVLKDNQLCDHCKTFDYSFQQNKSFCYYEKVSAKIVKGLKYGHRKFYAKHVAEMMTENKDYFEDVDIITFVPINKRRMKERGFNQAEEIAREISLILNKPVDCLILKSDSAKHQAGLSQKERLENLKGTFSVDEANKNKIKGKTILIVDDVFTTGATLSECANVIKKFKPIKIKTLTFAKTKFLSKV